MIKRFTLLLALVASTLCSLAQEVRNEFGAIVTPAEGVEKAYSVESVVISPVGFGVSHNPLKGVLKMVYCEDGTVYMQQPLLATMSGLRRDDNGWIKGVQDGNLITFPADQVIAGYRHPVTDKVSLYRLGFGTVAKDASGMSDVTPDMDTPIVFEVKREGKIVQLLGTGEDISTFNNRVLCTYYETAPDYYITASWWNYATRLILDNTSDHNPAVVPPYDAEPPHDYLLGAYDHDPSVDRPVAFNAQLVFDGADVYLGGFSYYGFDEVLAANRWIKGTRDGDRLVFPKEQYIMTDADKYDLYVYGLAKGCQEAVPEDFVLHLDAKGNYVAENDLFISYEKMSSSLDRAERLEDYVLHTYKNPVDHALHIEDIPVDDCTVKYYERHGVCVNANSGGWPDSGQEGLIMEIYYANDGKTVYMLDPLSLVAIDVFIVGTIEEDGKIHVPMMQWLQRDNEYGDIRLGIFKLQWIDKEAVLYTYHLIADVEELTFTIDADGDIYLDPIVPDQVDGDMPPTYMYGMTRGGFEYVWSGVSDAYTVLTETAEPAAVAPITFTPLAETYYDFSGRRLQTPTGLHIAGGRKVVR